MKRELVGLAPILCAGGILCALAACSASGGMGDDMAGADLDSDMDGDSDSDSDGDSDSDSDTDPPEQEEAVDYKVPKGSGRYVFIADEAHHSVVIIDSDTLVIEAVEVGARPTHLVPMGDDSEAAVIAIESDEVSLIRVGDDGAPATEEIEVRPDTNALAASNDGEFLIAYWDARFVEDSGAPGTDQEISVIHAVEGAPQVYHMSVGMHPVEVLFNEDSTRAFVITEEGISVIDLTDLPGIGIPPQITMFNSALVDPETVEISIDPAGDIAIAREEGSPTVVMAWLDGTDETREYTLAGAPTDLDISPDGTFGLFVLRDLGQVVLFDLPLPADPLADPFETVDLGELVCGVATLTWDGDTVLLHTTTGGDQYDRRILTEMIRQTSGWQVSSALMEREIKSVAAGPTGETAVVVHQLLSGSYPAHPYAYSLVKLPQLQIKFQQIPVPPGQLLLTPDGDYGYLLLRDDASGIRRADVLDMSTFIVDALTLGSPPTASGYAAETDKVFVAQDHPAGRMTFIGVHDGTIKTVTGYALNDEITD